MCVCARKGGGKHVKCRYIVGITRIVKASSKNNETERESSLAFGTGTS